MKKEKIKADIRELKKRLNGGDLDLKHKDAETRRKRKNALYTLWRRRSRLLYRLASISCLLFASACSPSKPNVTGEHFEQIQFRAMDGAAVIENSFVEIKGEIIAFFDSKADGEMLKASNKNGYRDRREVLRDARFSYVTKIEDRLFVFVTRSNDIFRLESFDDGETWQDEILILKAERLQWNVAVEIDKNGLWHMLVETGDEPSQADVRCDYYTSADGLTWMKETASIDRCGNPYLKETSHGILAMYGKLENVWHVTTSILENDGTWRETGHRIEASGIHVCDPHAIEVDGKILLSVSYDQNSIVFLRSDLDFDSFFKKF